MIIKLKNADFSANNIGKIKIPGTNINNGEGTSNPLLFKYKNTTGDGEFLGVEFVTKENPSPFPIIRKLHNGGTAAFLYSYLTADKATIDFPITPKSLSMAVWINKTAFERFIQGSNYFSSYFTLLLQVYDSGWKKPEISGGDNAHACIIRYNELSSENEFTEDLTSKYMNMSVKRKILDTKVINDETWVCIGFVFYNIVLNTSTYEANCRPRIAFNFNFMKSSTYNMEISNLQVVESADYLDPHKEY